MPTSETLTQATPRAPSKKEAPIRATLREYATADARTLGTRERVAAVRKKIMSSGGEPTPSAPLSGIAPVLGARGASH